ncbi:bifunctional 2-polyprenyl-6-hydroxyphenol methylase/3-demethylubiquinol 3-O-methyltransferase UbiG [uncultured Kordia sp.]|uniref:class I SAM-dependent methyltransferase n=1 Tax=uncultured Kordia sp. TaxID=507699 RepID=UPI002637674D|nr:class I SAM-dependent methyltransferase [uncultured Kordia sp.]
MQTENTTWYASWFDTPYYHILYKDRGYDEAEAFMKHLVEFLNLPEDGTILDLACGKGRHSVFLNTMGYNVTGVDLSPNSIAHASEFANETLRFEVHDMCKPYPQQFDAVFNLFTSFGYFEHESDNLRTIKSIKAELNEHGFGVIDFLNADFIIENLVENEIKEVDGIIFRLHRYVEDGFIYKDIRFEADGRDHHYTEKVKALSLKDFESYFTAADINLLAIFGDYSLGKFNKKTSTRLIMIFK